MRVKVVVATPLRVFWPHAACSLPQGILLAPRPAFKEADWSFWNLRRTEATEAMERSHWLRLEQECDSHDRNRVMETLSESLRTAMLAFQLWCVQGWDGLIVGAQVGDDGVLDVETTQFVEPYPKSNWSRMMSVDKLDPSELPILVDGLLNIWDSGVVRAINPCQFFEIGLQTACHHTVAGALLWTIGLDGLLVAEKQKTFARRLKRLLGEQTPVFPPDYFGRRPVYTVAEVAAEIYDLRNLVAHGKEVLQKYREDVQFEFDPHALQYLKVENWNRVTLLAESALFTLAAALRSVITHRQTEMIADKKRWEAWLDSPA